MSFDEEDWNRPVMGSGAKDTVRERRSLISNDNGVLDGIVPPTHYTCATYKGKFFTRGCRGMIESIQIYCRDAGADRLTLRYSPHPCLGPIGEVTITPLVGWSWVDAVIEEMWNYDSIFIWVYKCDAGTDWAYDAVLPHDGHESSDAGATWEDLVIRPFIRVVYSGETPGDVPVSGIINNIPIPYTSSAYKDGTVELLILGNVYLVFDFEGAGYCDLLELHATEAPDAEWTNFRIEIDDMLAWAVQPQALSNHGYIASTPGVSLLAFGADATCYILVTKRLEFRRRIRIEAYNNAGVPVTVGARACLSVLS